MFKHCYFLKLNCRKFLIRLIYQLTNINFKSFMIAMSENSKNFKIKILLKCLNKISSVGLGPARDKRPRAGPRAF
jgi:hypothetical protein